MARARELNWLSQIYYDVFHADKNHFVNCVLKLTIDIYLLLDLQDEFSLELGSTHNLGNLMVGQSESCKASMKKTGHTRDSHGAITGGERRTLTHEKTTVSPPIGDISVTFSALMPLVRASRNTSKGGQVQREAKQAFIVLHNLWTKFEEGSKIRLSMSTKGDQSAPHQAAVQEFFDILRKDVNSELVTNLAEGLTYMCWPDHYVAEHLSQDMVSWNKITGGVPFGRSSNQVAEHMNKVVKNILDDHTNDQVSTTNKRESKFFQVLRWLGIERFCAEKLKVEGFRKKLPCQYCVKNGGRVDGDWLHHRTSSALCSSKCAQTPLMVALGGE